MEGGNGQVNIVVFHKTNLMFPTRNKHVTHSPAFCILVINSFVLFFYAQVGVKHCYHKEKKVFPGLKRLSTDLKLIEAHICNFRCYMK